MIGEPKGNKLNATEFLRTSKMLVFTENLEEGWLAHYCFCNIILFGGRLSSSNIIFFSSGHNVNIMWGKNLGVLLKIPLPIQTSSSSIDISILNLFLNWKVSHFALPPSSFKVDHVSPALRLPSDLHLYSSLLYICSPLLWSVKSLPKIYAVIPSYRDIQIFMYTHSNVFMVTLSTQIFKIN